MWSVHDAGGCLLEDAEIAEIERRADAATPGPWAWREKELNERAARRLGVPRRRLPRSAALVYCLTGPCLVRHGATYEPDEWDYHQVMMLHRNEVRDHIISPVAPSLADAAFIAHARTDVPRLVAALRAERAARLAAEAEVERLRQLIPTRM